MRSLFQVVVAIGAICTGLTLSPAVNSQELAAAILPAAFIQGQEWLPLREGAKEYGISDRTVDQLMGAGLMMKCPGAADGSNSEVTNGWLLGPDQKHFCTNAHLFQSDAGVQRNDFGSCKSWLFREIDGGPVLHKYLVKGDSLKLGNRALFSPTAHDANDRACGDFQSDVMGGTPLALADNVSLAVGDEVFAISRRPDSMKTGDSAVDVQPMIQKCEVLEISPPTEDRPRIFQTSCTSVPGNSGGLYFKAKTGKGEKGELAPVGMHRGALETIDFNGKRIDGLPPAPNSNAGEGIVLDPSFFKFPRLGG